MALRWGRRVAYANPVLTSAGPADRLVLRHACPRCSRDKDRRSAPRIRPTAAGRGSRWSWRWTTFAADRLCRGRDGERAEGLCYILPVHRNTLRHDPHGGQEQFVLENSNLLEWKLAGYIPQPGAGPVFVHEGNLAACDGAGLKVVMRTELRPRCESASNRRPPTRGSARTAAAPVARPRLSRTVQHGGENVFRTGCARQSGLRVGLSPAWQRRGLAYKIRKPGESWGDESCSSIPA